MRLLALLLASALLVPLSPAESRADGLLSPSAECSGNSIVVSWFYAESTPVVFPDWVGIDIYRSSSDPCTAPVRINSDMLPRPANNGSGQFVDVTPSPLTAYTYSIVPVDQNRQQVNVLNCDCNGVAVAACPSQQAAVVRGTLQDVGWAMFVTPCPGICSPISFVTDHLDELRPYAQAGTPLSLYGKVFCGFEGCSVSLDHFEVAECGPVPTLPKTWGGVKARYR
jgi:hypothetical protein